MEKAYSYIQHQQIDAMSLNGTSIKYGKQPDIEDYWQQIIACDDKTQRHALIDGLVEKMSENSAQNGFWTPQQELRIVFGMQNNSIHVDDMNLYYYFFDNLKAFNDYNKASEQPMPDGAVMAKSILFTINNYFGPFNGDLGLRNQLTELNFDTFTYPSISVLRGKGVGACVEKAAVAHNLWLLGGRESYYVSSTSAKFEHSNDEGHAFCFMKNSAGEYMLYDAAMGNFGHVPGNPIESMLNGEPLVIGEPFKNHGIYANACNMEQVKTQ